MRRYTGVMILVGGVLLGSAQAQGADVSSAEKDTTVKIALTKLDVNDTRLKLSWKIRNDTDHDVWICDTLGLSVPFFSECFLDTDVKTLLIRRRFDFPRTKIWEFPFYRARYARLRPGQEKVESYSRPVPIRPTTVFRDTDVNAPSAQRLVVEIGFYDEDLQSLILGVVRMAEGLSCNTSIFLGADDLELAGRFFGGWRIARAFHGEAYFRDSVTSGGDEIIMPHVGRSFNSEQVLRLTVDSVSIPYKDH